MTSSDQTRVNALSREFARLRIELRNEVARLASTRPAEEVQIKSGERGPKGDRGERGEAGERGPRPAHKWVGTKLAFQTADGEFEEPVELRGPRGRDGGGGIGVAAEVATQSVNGYFPQGWP